MMESPNPHASSQLSLELKRYEGGGPLGTGTFGEVFLATRKTDMVQVAIKRMKERYSAWNEIRALKEVMAVRFIPAHPCIVDAYEVIKGTEDRLYLVFEYMPDGSLHELLSRTDGAAEGMRLLDEALIHSLMRQILSGVEHCHRHSFFHRDVKPENILLRRRRSNGELVCKLADFSLARRCHSNNYKGGAAPPTMHNVQQSEPTSYISTRWYRAPEILLSDRHYSYQVDVFAAGCIMAELYELNPLFPGDSEIDQLYKVFSFLGMPTMSSWPEGCALAQKLGIQWPSSLVGSVHGIVAAAKQQSDCSDEGNIIERLSGLQQDGPVSEHALDLFLGLIEINPNKRLTAHDALVHSYFVEPLKDADVAIGVKPAPRDSATTIQTRTSPTSVTEMPLPTPNPFVLPRVAKHQQEEMDLDLFFLD